MVADNNDLDEFSRPKPEPGIVTMTERMIWQKTQCQYRPIAIRFASVSVGIPFLRGRACSGP